MSTDIRRHEALHHHLLASQFSFIFLNHLSTFPAVGYRGRQNRGILCCHPAFFFFFLPLRKAGRGYRKVVMRPWSVARRRRSQKAPGRTLHNNSFGTQFVCIALEKRRKSGSSITGEYCTETVSFQNSRPWPAFPSVIKTSARLDWNHFR